MLIGFYIDELNFRGIANSTFKYAHYNEKILKNKSIIFYNKRNYRNKKEVKNIFANRFPTIGVKQFRDIETFNKKYNFNFIYVQKGGEIDNWKLENIKLLVHCIYPQSLSEVHGYSYAYVSEWQTKEFSNNKINNVPYIVELKKTKKNLKKELKISNEKKVFGCHGGSSSFDIQFVKNTVSDIVKKRKDIVFLFLNIDKFTNHSRVIFLKGTFDEIKKRKFLNTCDAMIYGRSLGESFGLACAEFSFLNKKIISYKYNRHRNHIFNLNKNDYIEYNNASKLNQIIVNFKKTKSKYKNKNKNYIYSSKLVMKKFEKIFFKKMNIKINLYDKVINFIGLIKVDIFYIKHKLYNHYYKILVQINKLR